MLLGRGSGFRAWDSGIAGPRSHAVRDQFPLIPNSGANATLRDRCRIEFSSWRPFDCAQPSKSSSERPPAVESCPQAKTRQAVRPVSCGLMASCGANQIAMLGEVVYQFVKAGARFARRQIWTSDFQLLRPLACPHCSAALQKAWWRCMPSVVPGDPDFTCGTCGKPSFFPTNMRFMGFVLGIWSMAVVFLIWKSTKPDPYNVPYFVLVMLVSFVAYWIASALVCAGSSRLITQLWSPKGPLK